MHLHSRFGRDWDSLPIHHGDEFQDNSIPVESTTSPDALTMAKHHLYAFVFIMLLLLGICLGLDGLQAILHRQVQLFTLRMLFRCGKASYQLVNSGTIESVLEY
jgi:hypothetical protein